MNLAEKILAAHVVKDARAGALGAAAVKPGDAFFARTDVRFSHEYVTPMAESLFVAALGPDAKVLEPESVFAFRDHLTFLDLVMPRAHRDMGLQAPAERRAPVQARLRSSRACASTARATGTGSSWAAKPSATTR